MENATTDYDARYLAGILFFNQGDYFEAHEVWEALWMETGAPERKFYQGLIQAAVALYHFGNGNLRGAVKLFRSSRDYLNGFDSPYLGLDITAFWGQMERCFADVLAQAEPDRHLRPRDELLPVLTLDPPPASWPDLADFDSPED
jgi:predicted metal-dependent hydrolase